MSEFKFMRTENGQRNDNLPWMIEGEEEQAYNIRVDLHWKYTILDAGESIKKDRVHLKFAKPQEYREEGEDLEAFYLVKHGIICGQPDDFKSRAVGIDWSKVKTVIGRTYPCRRLLHDLGFEYDKNAEMWVKE